MRNDASNVILQKTTTFSIAVINYCEQLSEKRKFVIANQLLRSGTSIGANVHEAQDAESKNDFIHKMKIAAKEINETKYWLMLCQEVSSYPSCDNLQVMIREIEKIITKIIATIKNQLANEAISK